MHCNLFLTIGIYIQFTLSGLFNQSKSIRIRVNYLFLRFVKSLRPHLSKYVESILSIFNSLLIIKPRPISKPNLGNIETNIQLHGTKFNAEFDSQLYLFEAIGYLISIEEIPLQRQAEILTVLF